MNISRAKFKLMPICTYTGDAHTGMRNVTAVIGLLKLGKCERFDSIVDVPVENGNWRVDA